MAIGGVGRHGQRRPSQPNNRSATVATLLKATFLLCLAVAAPAAFMSAAAQQAGRTITIVVPYTPGTGIDILARLLGEELQKRWGQSVVVENKPGASGNIGTQQVARAAPDGHTLLMAANTFVMNASLFKSLPYDPQTSFAPIAEVATGSIALVVHPSLAATNVRELIADAKARPGQINYASPGARHPAAYDHGAVQAHRWRLADARALLRLGRGRTRPRRRSRERDVPAPAYGVAAGRRQADPPAGHRRKPAVGARPRHADPRRAGRQRLRCRSLVCPAGTRRHRAPKSLPATTPRSTTS